jgi:hypothetical protein
VYVNHTPFNTDPGPQHYFEAAYFVDSAGMPALPAPPGGPAVKATLAPRWFSYHHPTSSRGAEEYPYRNARGQVDLKKSFVTAPLPAGAGPTSWRTIQLEVHSGTVSAHCGGGGLAEEVPLGTLGPQNRADFLRSLSLIHPDLRALNLTPGGTGAGVYVDSAVCNVSEFVIEPLAAP